MTINSVAFARRCLRVSFAALVSSALFPLSQARTLPQARQTGTLLLTTSADFEPMNFKRGATVTGFEVELANAIAKKMGLKPVWQVRPFDTLLRTLNTQTKTIDIVVASHAITSTRLNTVDFSNPHYCTGGVILTRTGGPLTSAALKGRRLAAEADSTYFGYLKKLPFPKTVDVYKTGALAVQAVATRNADAVVTDRFVALAALKDYPKAGLVMSPLLWKEQVGMVFAKGNSELRQAVNVALAQLMLDGTYGRLSQKYFGTSVRC